MNSYGAVGSFGKRPRLGTSSNLTSMIQSMLKQQQDQEWSDMQDAWKNGGTFKGKPVTDADMLAYMKSRRDEIGDQNDPNYIAWNNNVQQLTFSIAESKMALAYKQGSATAQDVANFYKSQLANYPVDSEIYRTIATDAANWADSAKSAAGAGASASAAKALSDRANADKAVYLNYNNMIAVLNDAATRAGLIQAGQTIYDVKDPTALQALLDTGVAGANGTVYHWSDFQNGVIASQQALNDGATAYQQAGDISSAQTWSNERNKLLDSAVYPLNTFDERTQYNLARDQWESDIKAAQGNPDAIAAANGKYSTTLGNILSNATTQTDPVFADSIRNEQNALTGKDTGATWYETIGAEPSDAASTAKSVLTNQADQQAIANGTAFYGAAKPGGQLGVQNIDQTWGHDPVTGTVVPPDWFQQETVTVNGTKTQAWVPGAPIYGSVLVDNKGNVLSQDQINAGGGAAKLVASGQYNIVQKQILGYSFLDPTTGKSNQWAVLNSDGTLTFSTRNPFTAPMVTTAGGGTSLVVGGQLADSSKPLTGGMSPTSAAAAVSLDPNATVTNLVTPSQLRTPGFTAPPGSFAGSSTFDPSRGPEVPANALGQSTQAGGLRIQYAGQGGHVATPNPSLAPYTTSMQNTNPVAGTLPNTMGTTTAVDRFGNPVNPYTALNTQPPPVLDLTQRVQHEGQGGHVMPTISLPSLPGAATWHTPGGVVTRDTSTAFTPPSSLTPTTPSTPSIALPEAPVLPTDNSGSGFNPGGGGMKAI